MENKSTIKMEKNNKNSLNKQEDKDNINPLSISNIPQPKAKNVNKRMNEIEPNPFNQNKVEYISVEKPSENTIKVIYCINCGYPLKKEFKFCINCGSKIIKKTKRKK
jgi:hypothetical protein